MDHDRHTRRMPASHRWRAGQLLAAVLALAALAVLTGCFDDGPGDNSAQIAAIDAEWNRWGALRPVSYQFDYEVMPRPPWVTGGEEPGGAETLASPQGGSLPLSPPAYIGVWRITVEGDTVVATEEISGYDSPYPLTVDTAPTIDALFSRLIQHLEDPYNGATVTFDPDLHYPTDAWLSAGGPGIATEYGGWLATLLPP